MNLKNIFSSASTFFSVPTSFDKLKMSNFGVNAKGGLTQKVKSIATHAAQSVFSPSSQDFLLQMKKNIVNKMKAFKDPSSHARPIALTVTTVALGYFISKNIYASITKSKESFTQQEAKESCDITAQTEDQSIV